MTTGEAVGTAAGIILGERAAVWEEKGAIHTAREIEQQPQLWLETYVRIRKQASALREFLNNSFQHEDLEIILTGAGSSAFIGEILAGPFQQYTGRKTSAYASTQLITHPHHYFSKERRVLLISFARSGNSPESVAAVEMANRYSREVFHLIITCSPSGKLAVTTGQAPNYLFLLPEQANDQALAMTSSFTTMLLAGLLIARLDQLSSIESQIQLLSQYGERLIHQYAAEIGKVAGMQFDRVVFLGSGPLFGTAMESHLKVQELTNGKIICKFDSFLGFRHGPKVVISPETVVIYLLSNNQYVRQYELDLVRDVMSGEPGLYQIEICENARTKSGYTELSIHLSENDTQTLDEDLLAVCSVIPAQLLGFFKSLELTLEPDQPSANGAISRVVQGVNIYPQPH
jgi:tagatose-6-phosphate ketose/aldose isomerase